MKDRNMPAQGNKTGRAPLTYDLITKYRGALMGLAIISILIFHFTDDCRIYQTKFEGIIYYYNMLISSAGVDAFLALSGFGLYYSMKRKPVFDLRQFYWKRYVKVLLPYLAMALPSLFWRDILFEQDGLRYYLEDLLFMKLFQQGRTWYWYILMISLCYLIAPYVFQIIDRAADDITAQMRVITLFSFVTLLALVMQTYYAALFSHVNIALLRFPSFFVGSYFGRVAWQKKRVHPGVFLLGAVFVFLLPLRFNGNIIMTRYILASLFLFLLLLTVALLEYGPFPKCKQIIIRVLEWFGRYTLELYLTHVAVRAILCYLGYYTSRFRYEALMLVLSLLLSLLLKRVTDALTGLLNRHISPKSEAQ